MVLGAATRWRRCGRLVIAAINCLRDTREVPGSFKCRLADVFQGVSLAYDFSEEYYVVFSLLFVHFLFTYLFTYFIKS